MPWAKRITKPIPSSKAREQTLEINDYSLGFNSFISNDKFPLKNGSSNLWRMARNARIVTLGDYQNRKGFDFHSDAAGEAMDQSLTSTTGAADKSFNTVDRLAQSFTAAQNGRLTKVEVSIKNANAASGEVIVELWSDSGSSPSEMLARSSIASSTVLSAYSYIPARFPDAPAVVSGSTYWIVMYVQTTGTGSYTWGSSTSASTAKSSTDSGSTWSATLYSLNFKQYYAVAGAPKGFIRAYKSDGTKVTIFAHGTSLYSVNDVTGALTTIKTGLSASASIYRFALVNDILYYVNEYDGYRKWDFTTESQISATNYSNIVEHKGIMFLNETNDPNKWVFSNFADYETFTSTDFIYVPSPKTGDPSTAVLSLNGYLLIWTRNSKYILSGDDNATFTLDQAPDSKGTYNQETVAKDKNFAYYLSDDGLYRTNGSEAQLISDNNFNDVLSIQNKEDACVAVNKGRIYLWHQSSGVSANNVCFVWNPNYSQGQSDCLESYDTNAYVSKAMTAFRDDDKLIVASSLVGQIYWQELETNDNTNLGGDIDFDLITHYMTFSSPAVLKEIRYWEPRFGAQSGNYTMSCLFASDLRDNWQIVSGGDVNVQGSGYAWGDPGTVWGSFTWGSTSETQAYLYVPGEYRRIALRYKHYATRQPQSFLGHTLVVQTRRMR